jgi:hypothetical protein
MKKKFILAVASTAIVAIGLTGCSTGANSADGVNAALATYISAQATFNSPVGDTSEASIEQAWVDTNGANISRMREAFGLLQREASNVEFPSVFTQRGEPSAGTITEYLNATDAYIAVNEQMQAETQGCISNGGTPYECVMRVGITGMSGAYPGVVERAQNAALQLREESSIG